MINRDWENYLTNLPISLSLPISLITVVSEEEGGGAAVKMSRFEAH